LVLGLGVSPSPLVFIFLVIVGAGVGAYKSLKQYLKAKFAKPFHIYFHDTRSDINCQIADYCGWAIYVRAERAEPRPRKEIEDQIKSCFDVFSGGTNLYYAYPK